MTTLADRYALGTPLGRSAGATVHAATDQTLQRSVAATVVPASPQARARAIVTRAHTAAGLSHPNLLPVLDAGESSDGAFVVTDRIEGGTLADRLAQGPLDSHETAPMLDAVLAALEGLHSHGLVVGGFAPWQVRRGVDGMWVLAVLPASDADATPLPLGGPIPDPDGEAGGGQEAQASGSRSSPDGADDLVALGALAVASLTGQASLRGAERAQAALSAVDDDAGVGELASEALGAHEGAGTVTAAELRRRLPGGAPAGLPATLGLPAPTPGASARARHASTGRLRRLARGLTSGARR